jgi:hypothetical protein
MYGGRWVKEATPGIVLKHKQCQVITTSELRTDHLRLSNVICYTLLEANHEKNSSHMFVIFADFFYGRLISLGPGS